MKPFDPASCTLPPGTLLTDAQREASMTRALADWNLTDDLWVFAYGSLIWNPGFAHVERLAGTIRGYHRDLCLWSRVNRGTPERPGLVFGLDRGGACRGIAYRVAHSEVPATFQALWNREMLSGSYLPRWLDCQTATGNVRCLTFVMNRRSSGYTGELCREELLAAVRGASGRYGPCTDYVLNTAQALREQGIRDIRLEQIAAALSADS
jgi:cation transport protein ChaC